MIAWSEGLFKADNQRRGKPDEEFALELLSDHLTMSGISGFQCAVHAADPPDLNVRKLESR